MSLAPLPPSWSVISCEADPYCIPEGSHLDSDLGTNTFFMNRSSSAVLRALAPEVLYEDDVAEGGPYYIYESDPRHIDLSIWEG
jgi:hypothetical protein